VSVEKQPAAALLPHLFTPLRLGPVELPNRIVSTAHQTTLVHDHLPTDDFVAYHEARARGGAGLIVLEATAPHPSGILTAHELAGYLPEIASAYRRVGEAVQPHGTRLFVQLLHGGREQIAGPPRAPALAPSAIPSQRFRVTPRALRTHEIEEIVQGFGDAAKLAAEGGLDGVEVSAAHRYLIAQFFDPELNLRDDEWAEPSRFLLAVVRAVRAAAPGLCVGVRLSADSAAAERMAPVLQGEVHYISLALGESPSYLGSTLIVPPPPLPDGVVADHAGRFRVGLPLIATSRVVDVREADAIVAAGTADALGMTRALIADPDLPAKARSGRMDEIVRCIGCQACIAHYHANDAIRCAITPRTGRERTWRDPPAGPRRRIVVVGAGPAGLTAAAEALAAGHDVVVLERRHHVGGQLALAARSPGARAIADGFAANHARTVARVDLRLGVEATATTMAELEPDAVLVSAGARPYAPRLQLQGDVRQAWELLADDLPSGASVVVADWGGDPAGLDVADALAAAGNDVTLAVASVAVGESVHQYRRNLYLQRFARAGVVLLHHHELVGAAEGEARFRSVFAPDLETSVKADILVLALGRVPEDAIAPALREAGYDVVEAGDCLSPRSLEEAVLEGARSAQRASARLLGS
jgi:2,4-dienoyl-CoA reductase-like NADH-dependent reductase (Old Yellow Enzyme family)/thioredoxin reductase